MQIMKNLKLKALFLLLVAQSAHAVPYQLVSQNQLFDHFFGEVNSRECNQNTKCKMLKRHLQRDSQQCQAGPDYLNDLDALISGRRQRTTVSGRMSYVGVFPGKYGYDLYFDENNELVLETRIHFNNLDTFTQNEIGDLKEKFKRASSHWTRGNTLTPTPVNFKLKLETRKSQSHISAKLQRPYTRGPYFSKWSTEWSSIVMAHEMGHMLGLDDEYKNNPFGGNADDCPPDSLMCNSHYGDPMDYHYYVILSRAFCQS